VFLLGEGGKLRKKGRGPKEYVFSEEKRGRGYSSEEKRMTREEERSGLVNFPGRGSTL